MSYQYNDLFINRDKDDLNETNDLFGVIDKGNAIIEVLSSADKLKGNNMLALYGNWGSGKTTLVRYIMSKLNAKSGTNGKKDFKTVFFEAWKYERDQNLALSLLEQILIEIEKDPQFSQLKENLKAVGETLLGFAKNILLNYTIDVLGCKINVGQAAKDTLKDINQKEDKQSLYYQFEGLKDKFKELEKLIKKKYNHVVIFIDDLDRCEPENVLNLLSAIKLFYSHNENFIFFCGVDKDAVKNSVDLKYRDVIKSNEYLEKIFDITLNMPPANDFKKIIKLYFSNSTVSGPDGYKYIEVLNDFFMQIGFSNPRHIKKVFNKFELLRRFKILSLSQQLPEIENDENIVLIIFTLYLIILHEFYKEEFDRLLSYERLYSLHLFKQNRADAFNISTSQSETMKGVIDKLVQGDLYISHNSIRKFTSTSDLNSLFYLIMFFLPKIEKEYNINPKIKIDEATNMGEENMYEFVNQFSNSNNFVQIGFLKFLLESNKKSLIYGSSDNPTSLKMLIKFIGLYM